MRRSLLLVLALLAACSASARPTYDEPEPGKDDGGASSSSGDHGGSSGAGIGDGSAPPEAAPPLTPDQVDPNAAACDENLAVDGDVDQYLRAINLCQRATEDGSMWGVIEASFSHDVGKATRSADDRQHGILPRYGDVIAKRHGDALGVLSTGWGREYNAASEQSPFEVGVSFNGVGEVPDEFGGFDADAYNLINLRLRIRVPSNAHGFSFDFDFFTSEWPNYLPSEFNDHFTAWLTDAAHPEGVNLSFDSQNRPVSVNLGFFDRCVDGVTTGCSGDRGTRIAVCPAGPGELQGTGFGLLGAGCGGAQVPMGGSTGWLTTSTPITPGEVITLEFAIWDEYDTNRDSVVLLDHFRWEADPVSNPGTTRPPN